MSLKPCRACKRTVDTSADFCPGCGATRPGHILTRQQYAFISTIIQLAIGFAIIFMIGKWTWENVAPLARQQVRSLQTPAPAIQSDQNQ